jgi:molybdenum cofactor synthesis domain-containing protein
VTSRTAAVVTVSNSVAAGTAEDRSGPRAAEIVAESGFDVTSVVVVPDGVEPLRELLEGLAHDVDLIVTTGGTGLSPTDLTPEATALVIDRPVPGLAEAMRAATFGSIPFGKLSRGISGIAGTCLIVNLPGSPSAVVEGLVVIGDVLAHASDIATGRFGRHS